MCLCSQESLVSDPYCLPFPGWVRLPQNIDPREGDRFVMELVLMLVLSPFTAVSQVLLQSSRGPGQLDDVESRLSQAHSPREDSVALPSGSNCSLCPSVHLPASPSRLAQLLAGSNMPTQHAGPTNVAGPHPAGAGALGPLLKRLGGTASPLTGPSSPESHRSAPDLFILKETSGSVTANPTPSQPPAPPSPDPTSDHLPSEGSRSSGPVLQKPSLLPSGGVEEPVDREAGVPPSGESKPGPLTP